jgi:hypothetical protein
MPVKTKKIQKKPYETDGACRKEGGEKKRNRPSRPNPHTRRAYPYSRSTIAPRRPVATAHSLPHPRPSRDTTVARPGHPIAVAPCRAAARASPVGARGWRSGRPGSCQKS